VERYRAIFRTPVKDARFGPTRILKRLLQQKDAVIIGQCVPLMASSAHLQLKSGVDDIFAMHNCLENIQANLPRLFLCLGATEKLPQK
jgi:hypothetical protein